MKKIISFIGIIIITISMSIMVLAGDIPEALLSEDDAQVFFGELISYNNEGDISYVEVIPTKAVKGDIILKSPCSYQNVLLPDNTVLNEGEVYLFAVFTSLNGSEGRGIRKGSIYVFEVSSTDVKTLKIKGHGNWDGDPITRLELYLNEGKFEVAEKKRLKNEKSGDKLRQITVSEFLKTDLNSVEEVTMEINGKCFLLDKELFMKISEETVLTPVLNGKEISFDGIYITVKNKIGFYSYLYITPDCAVDMYSAMFSRLPFEQYRADISFLKQIYAISPKEAQEIFPEFNPVESGKTKIYILYTGAILVIAGLFAVLRKRRKIK